MIIDFQRNDGQILAEYLIIHGNYLEKELWVILRLKGGRGDILRRLWTVSQAQH